MSYKYARIPLRSGLNVICGPNGSGKSSILLAISVALGQAHTERSQKLSGLIRWGENTARITLTFDNKLKNDFRPIPEFDYDYFRITRYLKNDDNYWFEANSRPINKNDLTRILKRFGLNPDNMLIIMHQHMMTEFGSTTPQKKLQMVEEAVGLSEHRRNVLEAQDKLDVALDEEESVTNHFKNAEQNLSYWKEEYEKFKRKKELLSKKGLLEREIIWAQLIEKEQTIERFRTKIRDKEEESSKIEKDLENNRYSMKIFSEELNNLQVTQSKIHQYILETERERINAEQSINNLNRILDDDDIFEKTLLEDCRLYDIKVDYSSSPDDKLEKFSGLQEKDFKKISETIETIDRKLNAQITQTHLLKNEMNRLEKERNILKEVRKSKKTKEATLQYEVKRLQELSIIVDKINPQIESLNKLKENISSRETRMSSFSDELSRLKLMLPFPIDVEETDEPFKFGKCLGQKLQGEVNLRENVGEKIETCRTAINYLVDNQQKVVAAIQVYRNEIEKLSKQSSEIQLSLDGKDEKAEIRCERCGSALSIDRWARYLEDVKEQIIKSENSLNPLESELKGISWKLSEKRKELDAVYLEEKTLETIKPIYDQTNQLLHDMEKSVKELDEDNNEKNEIIQNIAKIVDIDKSQLNIGEAVQNKMKEIFEEKLKLQIEIPRLEEELSNFENTQIRVQEERVSEVSRASETYMKLIPNVMEDLKTHIALIKNELQYMREKRSKFEKNISESQTELMDLTEKFTETNNNIQDVKSKEILLSFQLDRVKNEIEGLKKELDLQLSEIAELKPLTIRAEPRIETNRKPSEISTELKITDVQIDMLKDVSNDVEKSYQNYLKTYNQLKEKINVVVENRERALTEVNYRKKIWRDLLDSLMDKVNSTFTIFLEQIKAEGWVTITSEEDIRKVGLDLYVGFKGVEPQPLESGTHSGGERSATTMAFLLALQRHVKSPFRAVDEFDVHMDPVNREIISQILLTEMEKETESQYLTITPGQIIEVSDNVHIITVQRIEGNSEIRTLAENIKNKIDEETTHAQEKKRR